MPLNHVRRGGGEPLVLVHPLGAELVVWEPVLDRLAEERDVVALDVPGFGASPTLPEGVDPTPEALARAVADFMDELGLRRAHVAGNSLGGWIALELAKMGRARSITCLSAAGFWGRPLGPRPGLQLRTLGRLLLPVVPRLVSAPRGRRLVLGAAVGHPERVPASAALRLVRAYVTSPGFEAANAAMRSTELTGIERIDVPVTLAWAQLDRLVRQPRQPVPGARTVVLRECGHIPTWDDPDQVARVLLEGSGSALETSDGRLWV
jgi:pimeloyl-ACP methyl ester carboxylesterase